jgi:hypothetical protein
LKLDPSWEGGRVEGQSYLPYRLIEGYGMEGDNSERGRDRDESPTASTTTTSEGGRGATDEDGTEGLGSHVARASFSRGGLGGGGDGGAVSSSSTTSHHTSESVRKVAAPLLRRGCKQYTVRRDDLVELCAEQGMTPILMCNELKMYNKEIRNPKNRKIVERMGMVERDDPLQRTSPDISEPVELSEAEKDELSMYTVFAFVKDKGRVTHREDAEGMRGGGRQD